ncbi:MAG: T9SS type A sorting domain-containing protein [Chitinispirillaceae bacterium]
MRKKLVLKLCLASLCLFSIRVSGQENGYRWSTVAIGGGGFVSSIIAAPNDPGVFYARTDVGGAYRWDESARKWISLMDWVDATERGLLGVEAMAVDPQTPQKVYMVCGTSYWNNGRSAFLRSSDRGDSWEVIYTWDEEGEKGSPVTSFNVHGNGMGRGNGEALAIDPNNSDIMFYGSRNKGLFKSADNGTTWSHVDGFTSAAGSDTTWNGSGFSFVTFSPGSSDTLYAGFLRAEDNVFMSTDGGETWSLVPDRPRPATTGGYEPPLMPQRIAITPDGSSFYITFGDGAGPHTMQWDEGWGPINDWFNRGAVLKYDVATQTWTDVSPENFIDPQDDADNPEKYDDDSVYVACYSGVTINPQNPLEMVVTSVGYRGSQFWKLPSGDWMDQWGTNIYYSSDGGETWIPSFQYYWLEGGVSPTIEQMDENGIGWMFNSSIHWSGSVVMDPNDPKRVWVTSGNGVFMTEDITDFTFTPADCDWCSDELEQRQVWKVMSHGIEEVVPEEVVSIPGGPLVSIIADYDGFRHDDILEHPSNRHRTDVSGSMVSLGSTRALAYAPKAGKLVKVSDTRSAEVSEYQEVPIAPLQFSSDSGRTWSVESYPSLTEKYKGGACVAISTDGEVTLWTPRVRAVNGNEEYGDFPVYRYSNSDWTEVSGIDGAYVVGDPEDADLFYAYVRSEGIMYKSTDKGETFTQVGTPGTSSFRKFRLAPGRTGDIWVPLTEGGLARSLDGGESYTGIEAVSYCEAVGFGKAAPGEEYPAVYIFGTVDGVTGVFQSVDEGASWVRINDDEHEYGGLANGEFVMGDMNTFGVVYMSTAGRGIACRVPGEVSPVKPSVASGRRRDRSRVRLNAGRIGLSSANGEKLRVQMYDLRGRLVYSEIFTGSATLKVKSMARIQGTYLLKVRDSRGVLLSEKVRIIR